MIGNTISTKAQGLFEFSKDLLHLSNIYSLKFKTQIMLLNREPTFKKGVFCLWQFVTEVFSNIAEKSLIDSVMALLSQTCFPSTSKDVICVVFDFLFKVCWYYRTLVHHENVFLRFLLCETILFEKYLHLDSVLSLPTLLRICRWVCINISEFERTACFFSLSLAADRSLKSFVSHGQNFSETRLSRSGAR